MLATISVLVLCFNFFVFTVVDFSPSSIGLLVSSSQIKFKLYRHFGVNPFTRRYDQTPPRAIAWDVSMPREIKSDRELNRETKILSAFSTIIHHVSQPLVIEDVRASIGVSDNNRELGKSRFQLKFNLLLKPESFDR